MAHKTDLFPNPTEFRPERHLGSEKKDDPAADPWQFVFGFGRRYVHSLKNAFKDPPHTFRKREAVIKMADSAICN